MILVDTSVWVDHFKVAEPMFAQFSPEEQLLIHPFVLGEIALGSFAQRPKILQWLGKLTPAIQASHLETLRLIETQRLYGIGIGFIDAHLLASVQLTPGARLWTRDKRLMAAAAGVGVGVIADTRH
jgi:predicted nucleic acid-binding protein